MKWITCSKLLKQSHTSGSHATRLAAQLKAWGVLTRGQRYFEASAAEAAMPQFLAMLREESPRPGAIGNPHLPRGQQKLRLEDVTPLEAPNPPARSDVDEQAASDILRRIETKLDFIIALGIKPLSR